MTELPINQEQMARLMKLAATPDGRKLLNMLQREKGTELQKALEVRDYGRLKSLVMDFMKNPEAAELMKKLGR